LSKWVNKDLFSKYVEEKENDIDEKQHGFERSSNVWKTPEKGSADKPKVYEGRFLQDPKGKFTLKYYYHLFQSGDKWSFVLCPKTWDFQNWCPFCAATTKLYQGTSADIKAAYNYKRKERHVGNFYIVDDPRNNEEDDDDRKVNNTVKLYEFPDSVDRKLKQEIVDKKNGLGAAIFDPGEDGYNFIIKVRSTKPNKDGKVFPDYSDSTFARRPESLGSESEIKRIMEQTRDLEEYLKALSPRDDEIISILKREMLWEMVKDEGDYKTYKPEPEDDIPDFSPPKPVDDGNDDSDDKQLDEEGDIDESDLLEELDKL
jgi:hypothetical protein